MQLELREKEDAELRQKEVSRATQFACLLSYGLGYISPSCKHIGITS